MWQPRHRVRLEVLGLQHRVLQPGEQNYDQELSVTKPPHGVEQGRKSEKANQLSCPTNTPKVLAKVLLVVSNENSRTGESVTCS